MSYVLAVIDMQSSFGSHVYGVVENVLKEVKTAIENSLPVLIVEYEDCGDTHEDILSAIEGYDKATRIEKMRDDGSQEIKEALSLIGIEDISISLCGINLAACVRRTAEGLLYRGSSVNILAHACSQPEEWDDEEFDYYHESNREIVLEELCSNGINVL